MADTYLCMGANATVGRLPEDRYPSRVVVSTNLYIG